MRSLDVVVLGSIDEDLGDLSSEILRVKAALLYGDRVSLTTHKIPLLLARMAVKARLAPKTMEATGGLDPEFAEELAQLLEARWAAEPPTGELADTNMAAMLRALRGDRPEVVLKLSEVLARRIREGDARRTQDPSGWFRAIGRVAFENYARGQGQDNPDRALRAVDDLIKLNGASLVEISLGDAHELGYVELDELDQSFDRSVGEAIKLLSDASQREHPLFTASARLGLRRCRARSELQGADFTRANRVELASRLVASIPAFPEATVDELIDLRERVSPHLERFRAAVADLEDELNTDVLADEFDRAVDNIRQRRVEPALEELRQSLDEVGATRTLARATPTVAASTLALGASLATGVFEIAGVAAVAAGGTTAVAKEILERHRQEDERKKNRLFLLFNLERALAQ